MYRKTIIFFDKMTDRAVMLLSLVFFLICVYAMFDAVMVYYNANDNSVLKFKPQIGSDPAVMREISDDVVAWLTVDGTNIDYPIMQGKNNSEYINKNPYGDYSLSGSIFLDSRCDGEFKTDDYYLVYGHHMDYGSMFGALDRYKESDYFHSHTKGTLVVPDGRTFDVTLFAYVMAPANEKLIFNPLVTDRAKGLEYISSNAPIFENPDTADKSPIIALSTCQSAENIERMIVFGLMTPASSASADQAND